MEQRAGSERVLMRQEDITARQPLTSPGAVLLSNVVPEMVIVTAPLEPSAKMAPPYKVDVPPRPPTCKKCHEVSFSKCSKFHSR